MSAEHKPTVLIVGAGLGGLIFGALLEKQGVPYTIFERSATIKPLEFLTISKRLHQTGAYKETLEPYRPSDYSPFIFIFGSAGIAQYIVARPQLHALFLKLIPSHKIHFGHRVLNISEEDDRVTIHLSNNTTFEGDIVVGADGAYSAVRQRMYEKLKAKGELPKSDEEDLPFSCTCLVGQTEVLDPEEYPIIKEPLAQFAAVLGKERPYTWTIFTTPAGTLCWMVMHHLSKATSKAALEQRFRNTDNAEWGGFQAQAMCDETRTFRIPTQDGKKTLGDLYDMTPKDLISMVMLEEKVFKTWHSGRFVLLGDGAVTAIHDAISLANLLYAMPSKTSSEVTKIFEEYHKERYPVVMEAFNISQLMSKITERGLIGAVALYLVTRMPQWLWRLSLVKQLGFRPQAGFLKAVETNGTVQARPAPSEMKARAVYEMQQQQQGAASL
ncbi:hypothetical protein BGZ95_010881 [Linnemannia exigua]|uniref:FAD/NAD(P)-binding domain-containing protein n=1 Tax=Linnemannia exigua TaxID=604196 RepID=A0AAD4H5K3_9FUNG|nr:hypothetical protein BGZ95_010881 [Linnemannia exigua]